jgi:hypothetical protein
VCCGWKEERGPCQWRQECAERRRTKAPARRLLSYNDSAIPSISFSHLKTPGYPKDRPAARHNSSTADFVKANWKNAQESQRMHLNDEGIAIRRRCLFDMNSGAVSDVID